MLRRGLPYINNLYSLIGVGFQSFLIPVPYIKKAVIRAPAPGKDRPPGSRFIV